MINSLTDTMITNKLKCSTGQPPELSKIKSMEHLEIMMTIKDLIALNPIGYYRHEQTYNSN